MRLQYCQLFRSTHFTHKLRGAKAQDCYPVLAFDLVLSCGDNFWSYFLQSIVLVVKAFQHQETHFSPHRNMQQEQRSLTICWTAWIVLPLVLYYPWSCSLFPASQSMPYTLTLSLHHNAWAHVDSHKMGSRLVGWRRRLKKPSMGTCGQGWVANCTQYIFSPEMSSHDCACTGHRNLATPSQVINSSGLHND